jgi:outer membrane protein assembly factor BamB
MPEPTTDSEHLSYRVAVRTAVVAAVFSLIIAAGLIMPLHSSLADHPSGQAARASEEAAKAPAGAASVEPPKTTPVSTAGGATVDPSPAWPRFRGPDGSGISPYTNIPDDWDGPSGKNILWKSPIPLGGNSSPIIAAGRIFFTGADENKRQVFCYDAASGKLLWTRDVPSTPESRKPVKVDDPPGFAACTMATDGRYAAAIFANGDLAAYNLDGKLAWSKSLGIPENGYGYAASLAIYKGLLLVPFDQGNAKDAKSKLLALDIATGRPVWEQTRPVGASWSTPVVIHTAKGDQVVTTSYPWFIAYNPADGKELWRVKCPNRGDVAPSPVAAGDIVIALVNDGGPITAIRPDGSGDVSTSKVLWKGEDNPPDICSPVATEDLVFVLTSEGLITCYDAHKGDKLWEHDLKDFTCKSSPSMVNHELYVFGEKGKCWILAPTREGAKQVRQVDLGEECVTCAAFKDGRMYVRGKKDLICIGKKP